MLPKRTTLLVSKWWDKRLKLHLPRTFRTSQEIQVQTTCVLPLCVLHWAVFSFVHNDRPFELLHIWVSSYVLHNVLYAFSYFLTPPANCSVSTAATFPPLHVHHGQVWLITRWWGTSFAWMMSENLRANNFFCSCNIWSGLHVKACAAAVGA